jgi:hypothetical protein
MTVEAVAEGWEGPGAVDVVYTWVNGDHPGYQELLSSYAKRPVDQNPNRTRDNLDCLRYSLRSLIAHAPWIRRVHLVTMRPQLPWWLEPKAPRLTIHHHDEIFDAGDLPTFNSFAILSNLHRIPGLSPHFVIMDDDYFIGAPVSPQDFFTREGRANVRERRTTSHAGSTHAEPKSSAWDEAVAFSNHLLDQRFGAAPRRDVGHVPVAVELSSWMEMLAEWPDDFARTRSSRFRAPGIVAPEHLYPCYLVHRDLAGVVPLPKALKESGYLGLMNSWILMQLGLGRLRRKKPKFFALNDNFGPRPNPRVVRSVRRFLESSFPDPSPFEMGEAGPGTVEDADPPEDRPLMGGG